MNGNDFDKSNMRQVILEYPNDLESGKKFTNNISLGKKEYSNLIICGMGGSGHPGEVLRTYLNSQKKLFSLPFYVVRNYDLPKQASKDSLIFISSYSGNTEETVSCFHQAIKLGATIVSFSEGGEIEKIASEREIPHVKYVIDYANFQPRYSLTYAFVAMNEVLTKIGLSDTIPQLPPFDVRSLEVKGEEIAKTIKDKTPVIYASYRLKILAKIWKIKINENSKAPAFWNYFPELDHNEINGFVHPQAEFHAIMLKDPQSHPRNNKRIDVTANLYKKFGVGVTILDIQGKDFVQQLIWSSVLGDWVAYYLAYEYNQDPTPVEMVELLKKQLKE